ncbi:hypothetical protein ACFWXB_16425 [Tsukamurella tyrosinosolvens]|uniref:hypothetical protein n=1 Tax=Tsukamurella tyrosinosolvens TaxID=57704 RepID=UPI002DD4293E|nr:hypothetical protein [Tsukamurella tyrosinosolvens]MEC4615716.1 hypothetical protein [Tsukamurella tyrosinosolvens]
MNKVMRAMLGNFVYVVGFAVGAAIFYYLGFAEWQDRNDVVRCGGAGGAEMHPGDRCTHGTDVKTYEEVKSNTRAGWGPLSAMAIGTVVMVGSGVQYVKEVRVEVRDGAKLDPPNNTGVADAPLPGEADSGASVVDGAIGASDVARAVQGLAGREVLVRVHPEPPYLYLTEPVDGVDWFLQVHTSPAPDQSYVYSRMQWEAVVALIARVPSFGGARVFNARGESVVLTRADLGAPSGA